MKIGNFLIGLVLIVILAGVAYGVNLRNSHATPPQNTVAEEQGESSPPPANEDMSLKATFTAPAGWKEAQGSNYRVFNSPDLKYLCTDGKLYTYENMAKSWEAEVENSPCFRAPIATGSEIHISNMGDMGMANYTLQNIPDNFTDGNNGNTVKNIKYIKVDGYDAVSWEDSYGENHTSNRNVVIIKGHGLYSITQNWKFGASNPYPQVIDNIVGSFKFTA